MESQRWGGSCLQGLPFQLARRTGASSHRVWLGSDASPHPCPVAPSCIQVLGELFAAVTQSSAKETWWMEAVRSAALLSLATIRGISQVGSASWQSRPASAIPSEKLLRAKRMLGVPQGWVGRGLGGATPSLTARLPWCSDFSAILPRPHVEVSSVLSRRCSKSGGHVRSS